jgi:enoyl-CoA hydratase
LRIAGENAKLGQPEVKLGLIAGYGGSQRLPRLVGKGAALQLLLTGEIISAQEALRIGLVNEVVPADRLLPRAEEIARSIAAVAPIAVRHTLDAVNHGLNQSLNDGLFLEASLFGLCCATEDKAEGTRAFLEKRLPVWKGH